MKIYNLYRIIIFNIFIIFSFSCQDYLNIETEDYNIKIPKLEQSKNFIQKDSSNIFSKNENEIFSICVIKKNKYNFISINDCVSKELEYFLKEKTTDVITTQNTYINGLKAVIINGKIYDKSTNYWSFAVLQKDNYYYIVRVFSLETKFGFNEYNNSKIIQSLKIK